MVPRLLRSFAVLALALATLAACAGGPASPNFTLTDQNSRAWSLADQRGKEVALFFGFTHCADTCPATLAKLTKAMGPNGEIAFVTVDPARDTPAVLRAYVSRFGGAPIVGLTGAPQQIARVERDYHVWSQKIPGKRGSYDYDEAHIATVFVIDRTGAQRALLDQSDDLASMTATLRRYE